MLLALISGTLSLQAFETSNPKLLKLIDEGSPWVVLSPVSDSETQSVITPEGQDLRKSMETFIQETGAEVLPLSVSERVKLERAWSLPFTGRVNEALKTSLKELEASLFTGSYSPDQPDDLRLLLNTRSDRRNLTFYEKVSPKSTLSVESVSPTPPPETQSVEPTQTDPPQNTPFRPITQELRPLVPSRELPNEEPRRRRPMKEEKLLEMMREELSNNKVLKAFALEHQDITLDARKSKIKELVEKSQNHFLTSTKIEYLRRAFILVMGLPGDTVAAEKDILLKLLEHRSFYRDVSD